MSGLGAGQKRALADALPQALMPVGAALRYPDGWGEHSGAPTLYGHLIIGSIEHLICDWLAEAWDRGHFYCAAEGGDQRCANPYRGGAA